MPNKIDLLKRVTRNLGVLLVDSVVGSAASNLMHDEALEFQNSQQLQGRNLYVFSQVGSAHSTFDRLIKGYTPGGVPTIQVAPSWGTNSLPTIGQPYVILDFYKIHEVKSTIEQSIKAAGKWFMPRTYATLTIVASTYEYSVPSGFKYIAHMHFVPSTTDNRLLPQYRIRRDSWSIENSKIVFNPNFIDLNWHNNQMIRIVGQGTPPLLEDDEDTYDDQLEEYLTAYCMRELSFRRMGDANKEWVNKYRAASQTLQEEEPLISTSVFPDSVRVD